MNAISATMEMPSGTQYSSIEPSTSSPAREKLIPQKHRVFVRLIARVSECDHGHNERENCGYFSWVHLVSGSSAASIRMKA